MVIFHPSLKKRMKNATKYTITKQYLYRTIRYTNKEKMGQQTKCCREPRSGVRELWQGKRQAKREAKREAKRVEKRVEKGLKKGETAVSRAITAALPFFLFLHHFVRQKIQVILSECDNFAFGIFSVIIKQ